MSADFLAGIRVLDLSQYLPGPYAGQILADLGAEVVKVEPPAGDPLRGVPPLDGDGLSAFYKLVNAGKTVVRLDLKQAAGKAAFLGLVDRADALIESFRPGALARLGLGAEALRARNPRLVHCALSGYGQSGPDALKAGHDINYMAMAGGLASSGTAARPIGAHPPTADFASGMQAALTVLAALLGRARSGQGATIDTSIAETVLAWQSLALTAAGRPGGEAARGAGRLSGGAACYQIYRTADGRFVTLGALEAKFWANFCRALGREDWIERHWEALPQTDLIAELAEAIAARPLAAWQALLAGVDCCYQAVLEPAEVPQDPQIRARGLLRALSGPEPRVEVTFPALFDGAPPAPRAPLEERTAEDLLAAWDGGST
jgi:crotonobetainyl-CoA:carnitine CoA-transferase CaiB-like acyl-CoA transferase